MDFGPGTYALGFVAGAASVLSPCVLPLIPILIASALSKHRFGTLALAGGLGLSFAAVGTVLANLGANAGLDPELFRRVAAALMTVFGIVMLSTRLSARFSMWSARVGNVGQGALSSLSGDGLASQFGIGLVLGLVWSPCVGPTLGAATTLAAQGSHLGQIAVLMMVFGLGAGAPLVVLGGVSRASLQRSRGLLASLGRVSKTALGMLFVALGVVVLLGYDRNIESVLLSVSPMWLTRLTTSI
ncbi:cytochrome c biogenesis CcdA family protein [Caballeronia sp. SEWSISQ10-4 2]|uniref:cytochrome c biogenesis CcdA family protein n=1 Tax=Caballeronia sp. SEWSISQ10-4 2 TaxID=2937438 RepID=UPI002653C778|nr:cytochrome c biogenesis CcdA family protein [Caballeronia sp. SEWSISQ10-4 2]MDN7181572.1 cytochrome c biogenesis CcdA family protein [Caballeronia sp. SEWSISQ10-4 2]